MKPLITALTICLVPLLGASAQALDTWDGSTNQFWSVDTNWADDSEPTTDENIVITSTLDKNPWYDVGADASRFGTLLLGGDMIFLVNYANSLSFTSITLNGTDGSATVQGTANWSGESLSIDATNGSVMLTKKAANRLTITDATDGYLLLTGGDADGKIATFWFDVGEFYVDYIDLNGGSSTSREAILIFDQDVTVQTSTGVEATGFCQVRVGSDDTFDAYNLYVGDGAVHSEFDMNTGTGLMVAEQLVVMGGDEEGEHGIFKVSVAGAEFYTE